MSRFMSNGLIVSSAIVAHEPNCILIAAQILPGRNSPPEVDVPSVGRSTGRAGPVGHQCRAREHVLIDCRLLAIRLDDAVEFIFGRQTPGAVARYAQRHRGIPIHPLNVTVTSAAFARGLAVAASHPCQFCFPVVDDFLVDDESRGRQLRRRARIAYGQRCARRDNKAQATCRSKAGSKSWQHCFRRQSPRKRQFPRPHVACATPTTTTVAIGPFRNTSVNRATADDHGRLIEDEGLAMPGKPWAAVGGLQSKA
jgi:hypothetical protein